MSRLAGALAVLCMGLLAGCGGLVGSDAPSSPTPTNTPAPVPSDATTPDPGVRAIPGMSETGIESPFALGRAHRAALATHSYTRRLTEATRFANGSHRLDTTVVTRVEPANATMRTYSFTTYEGPIEPVPTPNPTATRVEIYGSERFHVRFMFPDGTATRRSFDRTAGGQVGDLEPVLAAFDTSLRGRTAYGDRTCYRVRSTGVTAPRGLAAAVRLPDAWTVQNASLVALGDSRGLVHEYHIRYAVETPVATYTAVRRVRYTALGATKMQEPEWVPDGAR